MNNKVILSFLLLFLGTRLCAMDSASQSVGNMQGADITSFADLQGPHGRVLLLGDTHDSDQDVRAVVQAASDSMYDRVIGLLKNLPMERRLPVIAEISQNYFIHGERAGNLAPLFAKLVNAHREDLEAGKSPFMIRPVDPRKETSDFVTMMYLWVSGQIESHLSSEEITAHSEGRPLKKSCASFVTFLKKFKFNKPALVISLKSYIAYLEQCSSDLKKIEETYKQKAENAEVVQVIHEQIEKFDQSLVLIKKMTSHIPRETFFADAFARLFFDCKTWGEAMDIFVKIENLFIFQTDFLHIELYLLDTIMMALSRNNIVTVIMGDAHVKNLMPLLKKLHFEVLKEETKLARIPLKMLHTLDPNYNGRLLTTLKEFLAHQQVLTSAKEDQMQCFHCFKIGQMQKCAACIQAYFCDRECQKRAWAFHKKYCSTKLKPEVRK